MNFVHKIIKFLGIYLQKIEENNTDARVQANIRKVPAHEQLNDYRVGQQNQERFPPVFNLVGIINRIEMGEVGQPPGLALARFPLRNRLIKDDFGARRRRWTSCGVAH